MDSANPCFANKKGENNGETKKRLLHKEKIQVQQPLYG